MERIIFILLGLTAVRCFPMTADENTYALEDSGVFGKQYFEDTNGYDDGSLNLSVIHDIGYEKTSEGRSFFEGEGNTQNGLQHINEANISESSSKTGETAINTSKSQDTDKQEVITNVTPSIDMPEYATNINMRETDLQKTNTQETAFNDAQFLEMRDSVTNVSKSTEIQDTQLQGAEVLQSASNDSQFLQMQEAGTNVSNSTEMQETASSASQFHEMRESVTDLLKSTDMQESELQGVDSLKTQMSVTNLNDSQFLEHQEIVTNASKSYEMREAELMEKEELKTDNNELTKNITELREADTEESATNIMEPSKMPVNDFKETGILQTTTNETQSLDIQEYAQNITELRDTDTNGTEMSMTEPIKMLQGDLRETDVLQSGTNYPQLLEGQEAVQNSTELLETDNQGVKMNFKEPIKALEAEPQENKTLETGTNYSQFLTNVAENITELRENNTQGSSNGTDSTLTSEMYPQVAEMLETATSDTQNPYIQETEKHITEIRDIDIKKAESIKTVTDAQGTDRHATAKNDEKYPNLPVSTQNGTELRKIDTEDVNNTTESVKTPENVKNISESSTEIRKTMRDVSLGEGVDLRRDDDRSKTDEDNVSRFSSIREIGDNYSPMQEEPLIVAETRYEGVIEDENKITTFVEHEYTVRSPRYLAAEPTIQDRDEIALQNDYIQTLNDRIQTPYFKVKNGGHVHGDFTQYGGRNFIALPSHFANLRAIDSYYSLENILKRIKMNSMTYNLNINEKISNVYEKNNAYDYSEYKNNKGETFEDGLRVKLEKDINDKDKIHESKDRPSIEYYGVFNPLSGLGYKKEDKLIKNAHDSFLEEKTPSIGQSEFSNGNNYGYELTKPILVPRVESGSRRDYKELNGNDKPIDLQQRQDDKEYVEDKDKLIIRENGEHEESKNVNDSDSDKEYKYNDGKTEIVKDTETNNNTVTDFENRGSDGKLETDEQNSTINRTLIDNREYINRDRGMSIDEQQHKYEEQEFGHDQDRTVYNQPTNEHGYNSGIVYNDRKDISGLNFEQNRFSEIQDGANYEHNTPLYGQTGGSDSRFDFRGFPRYAQDQNRNKETELNVEQNIFNIKQNRQNNSEYERNTNIYDSNGPNGSNISEIELNDGQSNTNFNQFQPIYTRPTNWIGSENRGVFSQQDRSVYDSSVSRYEHNDLLGQNGENEQRVIIGDGNNNRNNEYNNGESRTTATIDTSGGTYPNENNKYRGYADVGVAAEGTRDEYPYFFDGNAYYKGNDSRFDTDSRINNGNSTYIQRLRNDTTASGQPGQGNTEIHVNNNPTASSNSVDNWSNTESMLSRNDQSVYNSSGNLNLTENNTDILNYDSSKIEIIREKYDENTTQDYSKENKHINIDSLKTDITNTEYNNGVSDLNETNMSNNNQEGITAEVYNPDALNKSTDSFITTELQQMNVAADNNQYLFEEHMTKTDHNSKTVQEEDSIKATETESYKYSKLNDNTDKLNLVTEHSPGVSSNSGTIDGSNTMNESTSTKKSINSEIKHINRSDTADSNKSKAGDIATELNENEESQSDSTDAYVRELLNDRMGWFE